MHRFRRATPALCGALACLFACTSRRTAPPAANAAPFADAAADAGTASAHVAPAPPPASAQASGEVSILPPAEWGDVSRGVSYADPRAATRRASLPAVCTGATFGLEEAGRLCPCILREQWFDFAGFSDEPFCPAAVLRFEISWDIAVSFELDADEIRGGDELRGRVVWRNVTAEPRTLVLYRETPIELDILRSDRSRVPLEGRPCSFLGDLMGYSPRGLGVVLVAGGTLVAEATVAARRWRTIGNPCRVEPAGPLPRGRYFVEIVRDLLHDPVRPSALPFRVK